MYGLGRPGQREIRSAGTENDVKVPRMQDFEIIKALLFQAAILFTWIQLIGPRVAAFVLSSVSGFAATVFFVRGIRSRHNTRRLFSSVIACAIMIMAMFFIIITASRWWEYWVFPFWSLSTDQDGNVWLIRHVEAVRIARYPVMWKELLLIRDWLRWLAVIFLPLVSCALAVLQLTMLRELLENPATQQQRPWQVGPLHWLLSIAGKRQRIRDDAFLDDQYGISEEDARRIDQRHVHFYDSASGDDNYTHAGDVVATDEQWEKMREMVESGESFSMAHMEKKAGFTKSQARKVNQQLRDSGRITRGSGGKKVATEQFKQFLLKRKWMEP